ncbi:MAG: hypothetical protein WC891_08205 [Actinomycetota bacterium]
MPEKPKWEPRTWVSLSVINKMRLGAKPHSAKQRKYGAYLEEDLVNPKASMVHYSAT